MGCSFGQQLKPIYGHVTASCKCSCWEREREKERVIDANLRRKKLKLKKDILLELFLNTKCCVDWLISQLICKGFSLIKSLYYSFILLK